MASPPDAVTKIPREEDLLGTRSPHPPAYQPIPVTTLTPGTTPPFDLVTFIEESRVVFRRSGDAFTHEMRRVLADTGHDELYITREDSKLYFSYLEGNMLSLLSDEDGAGSEERLGRSHDLGVVIAGHLLEQPHSQKAFSLACRVVENSVDLAARQGEVLACISAGSAMGNALYSHSMRVSLYGLLIARGVGLESGEDLSDLGIGLMLHDIGRLGGSHGAEASPSVLSFLDREEMERGPRDHPDRGLARVKTFSWVGPIARDVIHNHHERLNGTGYPRGCCGEGLSIYARIAAVADAFDLRTMSDETHPSARSFDALREMITTEHGAFDPRLLALFVRQLAG
ncbi:MAG: HD-GYP domain-containing protein [Planctomycetota bacterium]